MRKQGIFISLSTRSPALLKRTSTGNIDNFLRMIYEIKEWLGYLNEKEDKQLIEEIRKNPLTGRPCGYDAFIYKIE